MEIIHQLVFKSREEPKLFQFLESTGIKFKAVKLPDNSGLSVSAQIEESNPAWSSMSRFIDKENILHSFETIFSEREILDAEWLRVVNVFEHGYPQPENGWIKKPNNYGEFCASCGVFKQTKPYYIFKEPTLGKNKFMSLIWTGDSLFTVPEVIEALKNNQIKGIEVWEVMIHKSKQPARSIFQIFIPEITAPSLIDKESLANSTCSGCGVTKYEYHRYGKMFYKQNGIPQGVDIVRTHEWFGSGHLAYREILISNRLAKIIIENKWKGLRMKVVQLIM